MSLIFFFLVKLLRCAMAKSEKKRVLPAEKIGGVSTRPRDRVQNGETPRCRS